jgi:ATP-dependent Zn protease
MRMNITQKHLVDKLKTVFLNLCQKIETTRPSAEDEVERLCALSVEEINQLVTEFENERSDIDTDAREALADEFCTILEAYSLPYENIEQVLSNRTW